MYSLVLKQLNKKDNPRIMAQMIGIEPQEPQQIESGLLVDCNYYFDKKPGGQNVCGYLKLPFGP